MIVKEHQQSIFERAVQRRCNLSRTLEKHFHVIAVWWSDYGLGLVQFLAVCPCMNFSSKVVFMGRKTFVEAYTQPLPSLIASQHGGSRKDFSHGQRIQLTLMKGTINVTNK